MENYINQIIHGDCLEVMKDMPAGCIDMILCDLPYGVTRNKWDQRLPLDKLWQQYERLIKPNGAVVLMAQQPFTSELVVSNRKSFKYSLVWSKRQVVGFLNANIQPLREHEDILVFHSKQCVYNPHMTKGRMRNKGAGGGSSNYNHFEPRPRYSDEYYPKSILTFPAQRTKGGHPTQKPVDLFSYLVKTYTNEGATVLDNCIGSGTTAIAALETGRLFIGIEKDECYYEMAKQRIREYKGGDPH